MPIPKQPRKPRKPVKIGFRVDIISRDTGRYMPHTADSIEEDMAKGIAADLVRIAQPGRLVRVTGKQRFPDGEVIQEWRPLRPGEVPKSNLNHV